MLTFLRTIFITTNSITLLFASLIAPRSAFSAPAFDASNLAKILREEIRKCPALNCADSRVQLTAMSAFDFASMPKETRAVIRERITELARDLWPDTILEGPYRVKFNVRVERNDVQILVVDGAFVGYRIGYSDKAWDMDQCNPMTTPESKQDLSHCLSGRIFDRGFVTSDLSTAFRDESTMSRFKKGE